MEATGTSSAPGSSQPPVANEDLLLATAVAGKDRKATAEFVDRFADPLYGYLTRRLSPRTDLVDDFMQEVFLAAWQHLPRYEGRSSLQSWLLGIARHKVEDHYRSRLREPEPLDDAGEESLPDPRTEDSFEALLDRERLEARARQVLDSLPETYRTVLLWRYWEKRSAAQMAAETGRSVKAVERLLARARQQFKRRWSDE